MRYDPRFAQFVGIPFQVLGRGHTGCDCYGLSYLISKDLWGVMKPKLGFEFDCSDLKQIDALINGHRGQWRKLDLSKERPRIGDDILFWCASGKYRAPAHIGVYCGPNMFIHVPDAEDGPGYSEIKKIGTHAWPDSKVYGYFRFEGLEEIDTCKVVM